MNCIGFRRALNARPGSQAPEVLAHRRECSGCDAFARRQATFESALSEAVKVPVPEGLASRVLVTHALDRAGARRARRGWMATAAVIALATSLAWLALGPRDLGREVIAHIDGERSHLADQRNLSAEKGPVTILFLPGEPVSERMPVQDGGFRGMIVPAPRGSIAIVGEPGEALEQVEQRLRAGVRFASSARPAGAPGGQHGGGRA